MTLVMLASAPAQAEEPSARAWFEVGVKSYEEGRYTAALAAFQEAYRLNPRPGLLFSVAQAMRRSYEEEGDPAQRRDAVAHYERYLRENPQGDRSEEARAWLDQLKQDSEAPSLQDAPEGVGESRAARERELEVMERTAVPVQVQLRPGASSLEITGNAGAVLFLDGRRIATLPTQPLRLTPGRHTLEVLQAGHQGVRQVVNLEPGASRRLHLAGPHTVRHVASWLFIGAGSAAVSASAVFGYLALQREADARALQDTPGAGMDFDSALSARNRLRAAAALSAGLGVAAVLGGTLSLVTERPAHPAPATAGTPRPVTAGTPRPVVYVTFPVGVAVSGAF